MPGCAVSLVADWFNAITVAFCFPILDGQGNILLTPGPTQYVAEGFSGNVTFVCDVTAQANRSASAVWVINGIQIGSSRVSELQVFGIFIETIVQNTVISISLDGIARQRSQGLGLQCAESIPGFPPQITFSPSISIITYGKWCLW